MKIAIVDVCHTLYKSNTTFDYIDFVLNNKNKKVVLLKFKLVKYALIILGRFLHKDLYRYLYIKKLRGFNKSELEYMASEFYRVTLKPLKVASTFDIINKEQTNYKFILASASLNLIIESIIKNERIFEDNAFSSTLGFNNDICTGKLIRDLLGNKHIYFSEVSWVITDNISDLNLAKKAEKVTILSKPKNIAFWERNGFKVDIII